MNDDGSVKSLLIFLWIIPLLFAFSAYGQSEFQGEVSGFGLTRFQERQKGVTDSGLGFESELEYDYRFSKGLRFQLDPWLKYDALALSPEEKFQINADEFSVEWRKSLRNIKLGYSIQVWEGPDFLNPMNVLHTRNWRDPLRPKELSAPGLFYSDQIGKWVWDVNYLVRQQRPQLPAEESPWWPREGRMPLETDETDLYLPQDGKYKVGDAREIDRALSHNWALRVQYIRSLFNFSFGAFEAASAFPQLNPIRSGSSIPEGTFHLSSPIEVQPKIYKRRGAVGAFVLSLRTWVLRWAGQYAQSLGENAEAPDWSHWQVVEIEKHFSVGEQDFVVYGEYIKGERSKFLGFSPFSAFLKESYMLGLKWPMRENWLISGAWLQEQESFSTFFRGELIWKFYEGWTQELKWEQFDGAASSALGVYDREDQVLLRTSYAF